MSEKITLARESAGLLERFVKMYPATPALVQAPGRVNLIGEHTDYNDGYVFPAAIAFQTRIGIAKRADRTVMVYSENYAEHVELKLDDLPSRARGHWSDYVVGVIRLLAAKLGTLTGADVLLSGDVPQGAGLSSSASLEVAVCTAFLEIAQQRLDGTVVAQLCQQAENEFVGARCGIMDQFISVHGKKDHALLLDCRTLGYQLLPIPPEVSLVICNTMVRHSHSASGYNQRRAECEAAVRFFSERLPGVKALRDISLGDFEKLGKHLPEAIRRRARHVITEDARVLKAGEALSASDVRRFGELMKESHTSLRDDFEVSCQEVDVMVQLAEQNPGVYGARMTGGGFGGCTINLVESTLVERFKSNVLAGYEKATGRVAEIYVSSAADGAGRLA
ncbi:MAG: galactokinase [Candidatus Acidiferrum sp.]